MDYIPVKLIELLVSFAACNLTTFEQTDIYKKKLLKSGAHKCLWRKEHLTTIGQITQATNKPELPYMKTH